MSYLSFRWISGPQTLFCMEFGISICSLKIHYSVHWNCLNSEIKYSFNAECTIRPSLN